jgi:protein-L-isoaspartate O-methyltransferase
MSRLFDAIGKEYNRTRRADPRIVARLVELLRLPAGATGADVGAGTGNYSNALADQSVAVIAIEPATTMWR